MKKNVQLLILILIIKPTRVESSNLVSEWGFKKLNMYWGDVSQKYQ